MSGGRDILRGAYDVHVHVAPDVVPRAQAADELAADAVVAGMAGVVLKDHTGCTAALAQAISRLHPGGLHFYGSVALNPPVGGLCPDAVAASLRKGGRVVFFPTYAARHQIEMAGPDAFPPAFPRPASRFSGLSILDADGHPLPEVIKIIELIAEHDAVLATGHLSPAESLCLLEAASCRGVARMVVTHASERVPCMSLADQRKAIARGAIIEHSLFALTSSCPGAITPDALVRQIRYVGVDHVVLSSDLGQPANGPAVAGFGRLLESLCSHGFTCEEIRVMISQNPAKLLGGSR